MKRHLIPLLVFAVGIVVGALIIATGPELVPQARSPQVPLVQTLLATRQTVRFKVTTHGTVMPKTESDLVAEVSGRVVDVSPALVSGGFFARGDVLVQIERIDYEVAHTQAKARLAAARSELVSAEKAYDRQRGLTAARSGSQAQEDEALNRLLVARASLDEAIALEKRAVRDLERTRLTAPYDGRVRTERVDSGQFINRGQSIATLYSIDFAEVRLPLPDHELAYLPLTLARSSGVPQPAVEAVLRAEFAGTEHVWSASVVRTEGELDGTTRMVNVIAQVAAPYDPPAGPPLTVGMFVEAEIPGREVADVIVVPRTALQRNNKLYVVDGDNRLEFRDVEILRITGETVYLRGDVANGEAICVTTLETAIKGQRVQPIGADAPMVPAAATEVVVRDQRS